MPPLKHRSPKYGFHRRSGQARVRIHGKEYWLGPYGSEASRKRYDDLVFRLFRAKERDAGLTTSQVCALFWRHAKRRYGAKGKGQYGNAICWRPVLRLIRKQFGKTPAIEFGPKKLRAVQATMVELGWSRTYINDQINRGRRAFKWAAGEELIPYQVYRQLTTVEGLRAGDTPARETEPISPVADSIMEATVRQLSPQVAAMVRFQRLTGCRPAEACGLTAAEVDRSGEIWIYRPRSHKTRRHNKKREIFIGPQAQQVLAPWLMRAGAGPVFRTSRKTAYSTDSYRRAIHRACDRAGIDHWSPNRLRHAAGTVLAAEYGLEQARVILGHSSIATTEIYAERDARLAMEAARRHG